MTTTAAVDVRLEVRLAVREDHPYVAEALAAAFADDPVVHWFVPDPRSRPATLRAMFDAYTWSVGRHEEIRTAGGITGAALWVPPGGLAVEPDDPEFELRMARAVGVDRERSAILGEVTTAAHPHEPHWYLNLLGVVPALQGQGLGSALLAPVLARCDRDGVGAYLAATTERSRKLYARHGFEVIDEIRLPDGPSLWPMWRAPRR